MTDVAAPLDLDDLADRIESQIAETLRMPQLDACRRIAQEVGIRRARIAMAEAPDLIARAQDAYRAAQSVAAAAKESLTGAIVQAEWELDGRFHTDGNKVYLRLDCECLGGVAGCEPDKGCAICSGLGTYRKFMTADERRLWKSATAGADPAVRSLGAVSVLADEDVAAARDAIAVAQARLTAAKHGLDAAVAELATLALGLRCSAAHPIHEGATK